MSEPKLPDMPAVYPSLGRIGRRTMELELQAYGEECYAAGVAAARERALRICLRYGANYAKASEIAEAIRKGETP